MLGLPKSTEMSKQLPKKAVYAKFQMNTAAKEKIDADISRITIVNEITPAKINIPAGEEVGSFFVLLVALKRKDFDEKTVATLSKLIPQNIELRGLNLDKVWENIIRSLELGVWNEELSLDENLALHEKQAKLKKEIEKLEKLARKEKQPKKKFELVQQIKKLNTEMGKLK